MDDFRRYRKRDGTPVVAVRLSLETDGFTYHKWGGEQRCRAGDWIVDNGGDVYTVRADVFARTYRQVSPGVYRKVAEVLARQATEGGTVRTLEGTTDYLAGDYLVMNEGQPEDMYAISRETFEQSYEPV